MFVNEYLLVEFNEVCKILDGLGDEANPPSPQLTGGSQPRADAPPSSLEFAGSLRLVSRSLALLPVRLPDQTSASHGQPAELRVIKVESGTPPMTELLLIVPSPISSTDARLWIQEVAGRVEDSAFPTTPRHRRPRPLSGASA